MAEPQTILFALILVWIAIYLVSRVLPLEKYGLEVAPLYILYRTKRFNEGLRKIAQKNAKFWRTYANIAIVTVVVEIFLAIFFLVTNLQRFLFVPSEAAPITLMLPGITIALRWFPYILIAASFAITIHEMAHGILFFCEKIPVKSSGIFLAPLTFGGFVEPDEETFETSRLFSKLRAIAVGSLTNLLAGFTILVLLSALFVSPSGLLVTTVQEGGPAYIAGMRSWDVIYSINGYDVSTVEDFLGYMIAIGPGVALTVETSSGVKYLVTAASPENTSRGILGIRDILTYSAMRVGEINSQLSYHLFMTLNWISLIMINVAIFNMLPLFPFDGEAFIFSILKEKLKKGVKGSRIAINVFSLILLASNVGLTMIRYGLIPFG